MCVSFVIVFVRVSVEKRKNAVRFVSQSDQGGCMCLVYRMRVEREKKEGDGQRWRFGSLIAAAAVPIDIAESMLAGRCCPSGKKGNSHLFVWK